MINIILVIAGGVFVKVNLEPGNDWQQFRFDENLTITLPPGYYRSDITSSPLFYSDQEFSEYGLSYIGIDIQPLGLETELSDFCETEPEYFEHVTYCKRFDSDHYSIAKTVYFFKLTKNPHEIYVYRLERGYAQHITPDKLVALE